MIVCVVGSGGREHALALSLARSCEVVVAPGSAGMTTTRSAYPITCSGADPEQIEADLFVIGPEVPLVAGLADRLRARGRLVFGPGADGARLEGSKAFMKEFVSAAKVPTAGFASFTAEAPARRYLEGLPGPYVIKTDGLAAGKGVLVTERLAEAIEDVRAKLSGEAFGEAGQRVVIEEYLDGVELSLLVVCDGRRAVPLPAAQDFKRVGDGDAGPNTGGMGAYAPVPFANTQVIDEIMDTIVEPTIAELTRREIDYRGVLYAGCMLTADGPRLVEYNVRFGDPETEVVVPLIDSDLGALLAGAANGHLTEELAVSPDSAVCVVLAASGYPVAPRAGDVISGLDAAGTVKDVTIFHAGTSLEEGRYRTASGRVLVVTGTGEDLDAARTSAYEAVELINYDGKTFRRDIARDAVELAAQGRA